MIQRIYEGVPQMKNHQLGRWMSLLLLSMLPLPAAALCLLCTCSASATGVAFTTYLPFSGSNVDNAGNVRLTCSGALGTVDYSIALNKGLYSGNFSPRQMDDGNGHQLNYDLYSNSGYTTIWGDGTSGTVVVSGTVSVPLPIFGSGNADNPIFGRIPGGQSTAFVGSYSDTITVTVTYQ